MNNFPKPHTNNGTNDDRLVVSQFHKENTSPLPVIPKVNYYPSEWDKKKTKLPPLSSILSNHYYVVACVLFTSLILIIAMIKAMWLFLMK